MSCTVRVTLQTGAYQGDIVKDFMHTVK